MSNGGEVAFRQVRVLQLVSNGMSIREIASVMYVSERTVKNDLYRYCQSNDLHGKAHAVAHAIRNGVIE